MKPLSRTQYANIITDVFQAKVPPSARFPAGEMGASRTGFSTEPEVNALTKLGTEGVLEAAEEVAVAVAEQLPTLLPCAATAPTVECAKSFVQDIGGKLYRRPLQAPEVDALVAVFTTAQGAQAFTDGIALVTASLLQSPDFLYRVERGASLPNDPSLVALTPYELANRLSFLFWDSLPDAELFSAAATGNLTTPEHLRAQADRMLMDPRARAAVSRFAKEWLQVNELKAADRKGLSDELAAAQMRELELFVEDAFLNQGTLPQLLTAQATFANNVSAQSYAGAVASTMADDFQKVGVAQPERAGLLTLPAVMASKAHTDEPAYVFRGTFVLQKLLCADLASPPATATEMLPEFPPDASHRQKSSLVRKQDACAGCHNLIDPIGLAFEGFDELGRVRKALPTGQPVDSSGSVEGIAASVDGAFASPRALAEKLANSPDVAACVAKQSFRSAFGKMDDEADSCAIENLVAGMAGSQMRLRDLLIGLTQLDGFRFRKLEGL